MGGKYFLGEVALQNRTFKIKDVLTLTKYVVESITSDMWKKCIDHVIRLEEKIREQEGIVDHQLESVRPFIIHVSGNEEYSDSDSESDEDSDVRDSFGDAIDEELLDLEFISTENEVVFPIPSSTAVPSCSTAMDIDTRSSESEDSEDFSDICFCRCTATMPCKTAKCLCRSKKLACGPLCHPKIPECINSTLRSS